MLQTYRPEGELASSLVTVSGPDAQDFLHRITTVHVRALAPGQGGAGCLLTAQGRFRAFFHLWCVAPASYALEVPNGRGGHWKTELLAAIEQYTFAEKISVRDETTLGCAWALGAEPPREGAAHVFAHGTHELGRPWHSVWTTDVDGWLRRAGGGAIGDAELEMLRIRAMRARVDHEITESANPLEVGLKDAVADNKGCYPGQEVMEKIVALGAPARRLVRVEGTGPAPAPGSSVSVDGAEVGTITSSASSGGGFVALALVRKAHAREKQALSLPGGRSADITGVSSNA